MTVLFIEKKPLKKLCEFARSSLKINLKCIHNEYAVYVYVKCICNVHTLMHKSHLKFLFYYII